MRLGFVKPRETEETSVHTAYLLPNWVIINKQTREGSAGPWHRENTRWELASLPPKELPVPSLETPRGFPLNSVMH